MDYLTGWIWDYTEDALLPFSLKFLSTGDWDLRVQGNFCDDVIDGNDFDYFCNGVYYKSIEDFKNDVSYRFADVFEANGVKYN